PNKEKNTKPPIIDDPFDFLQELAYDPVYGARPLKRVLQQQLENPLSQKILEGKFVPGSLINIEKKGEQLEFKEA
ncbi:molecular chaperone, partial [Coxiella burnetii]